MYGCVYDSTNIKYVKNKKSAHTCSAACTWWNYITYREGKDIHTRVFTLYKIDAAHLVFVIVVLVAGELPFQLLAPLNAALELAAQDAHDILHKLHVQMQQRRAEVGRPGNVDTSSGFVAELETQFERLAVRKGAFDIVLVIYQLL